MITLSHWGLFPSLAYLEAQERYWFYRAEMWRILRSTQKTLIVGG